MIRNRKRSSAVIAARETSTNTATAMTTPSETSAKAKREGSVG